MHSLSWVAPARLLRRGALILLAATFVAGVFSIVPAAPAHAADDEAISGAPCDDDGELDDRSRFTYDAAPGQKVSDCFRVSNTGTVAQHVVIYGTDAFNTEDGSFGLLDAAAEPIDAGSWVRFAGGDHRLEFDLAPGQSRALRFAVTVPDDATPGDHAAGLIVSAQTPSDQILIDRRIGTRLYVRVPGELQSLLGIAGMTGSYSSSVNPFEGTATVNLTVTNEGNVALAPTLVLSVKSFFGADLIERRLENLPELLPGASRSLTYDLGPVGQWGFVSAQASLFSRGDQTGATELAPPAPQIDREAGMWAVPWLLVGVLVLLVLFLLVRRWRRRRDDRRAAEWMAFTQAEAQRAAAERVEVGAGKGA